MGLKVVKHWRKGEGGTREDGWKKEYPHEM